MKNIFIYLFIFLGLNNSAKAQNYFSGTVKDAHTKEPIIGASIYISDLKKGVSTDTSGQSRKYQVRKLPFGNKFCRI
jgi:iron complex outermembrane recepter protein